MENSQNNSQNSENGIKQTEVSKGYENMSLIRQRLANTIGKTSNVFISDIIKPKFNNPNGNTLKIEVIVESPFQKAGLDNILRNNYKEGVDQLVIDVKVYDENPFNVPPNDLFQYTKMGLFENPLVVDIEENVFSDKSKDKVCVYIKPVVLQYSLLKENYDFVGFNSPIISASATEDFKKVLKEEILVKTFTF
ncbi:hypothetical protein [Aureivirga sp. CE67]|uniref:hypothetical protein n=1 Tax=Aureivirga sp. CE67 TaxID=1788983 RepID=UPI0018C9A01B|nr:hypothetical protein [Aureivirga sp. CE67]